jgi:hypothetical protein
MSPKAWMITPADAFFLEKRGTPNWVICLHPVCFDQPIILRAESAFGALCAKLAIDTYGSPTYAE